MIDLMTINLSLSASVHNNRRDDVRHLSTLIDIDYLSPSTTSSKSNIEIDLYILQYVYKYVLPYICNTLNFKFF